MRDERHDERVGQDERPLPAAGDGRDAGSAAGATVSIPSRRASATPFGPTTLHARLALLRPRPATLRPAPGSER